MVSIIVLIVFIIEFIRIKRVNKIKFLNAGDQSIFLNIGIYFLSHYFIRNSDYINSLDIQSHTIMESFPNVTVGIRFLFARAVIGLLQKLCCPPLRYGIIFVSTEKTASSQYSGGSEMCSLFYLLR